MKKILFNGFRHSHIDSLYRLVEASDVFAVAGCIEANDAARANAEKNLGAVFSQESYDHWLTTDIDIVAIGGAYGDRGEAIIKALQAGKHVIADKPICTNFDQLATIKTLCREKGLSIQCMLDLRYLPQTLAAKRLLADGQLGQVRNIAFNGQHCLDYGNRPGWYFEPGMHGGTINDIAIHGVDLVRMLTDMEFSGIDAARTWNAYAKEVPHFQDSALFMARLENGAGVMADVSYAAPKTGDFLPTYWEFRIWCDQGLITFNWRDPFISVYTNGCSQPEILRWEESTGGYLPELLAELETGVKAATENVLRSTETVLQIQAAADKEKV